MLPDPSVYLGSKGETSILKTIKLKRAQKGIYFAAFMFSRSEPACKGGEQEVVRYTKEK